MKDKYLQNRFIGELLRMYPQKARLSTVVAEILKIERESAVRRLNGRVNFSINEMGVIATALGISLDQLLADDDGISIIPLRFYPPNGMGSIDEYLGVVKPYLKHVKDVRCDYVEMGVIFNTLPLEFITGYPYLCRFYYFKLGRYNIDASSFSDFSRWKVTRAITEFLKEIGSVSDKVSSVFYIWNYQTISTWMNDVKYFYSMGIIGREDAEQIKSEMHQFLYNIESRANGSKTDLLPSVDFSLYISRLDLGISYVYHNPVGGGNCSCFLRSLFSYSFIQGNSSQTIRAWIRSMREVSTLISGTGEPERVLFFKEQHRIVDNVMF